MHGHNRLDDPATPAAACASSTTSTSDPLSRAFANACWINSLLDHSLLGPLVGGATLLIAEPRMTAEDRMPLRSGVGKPFQPAAHQHPPRMP